MSVTTEEKRDFINTLHPKIMESQVMDGVFDRYVERYIDTQV